MTHPRTVRALLAYISILMLAGAFLFLVGADIKQSVRDVLMVLVGALITNAKDSYGFFFGTSQSSTDKNEVVKRAMSGPTGNPGDPVHVEDDDVSRS